MQKISKSQHYESTQMPAVSSHNGDPPSLIEGHAEKLHLKHGFGHACQATPPSELCLKTSRPPHEAVSGHKREREFITPRGSRESNAHYAYMIAFKHVNSQSGIAMLDLHALCRDGGASSRHKA